MTNVMSEPELGCKGGSATGPHYLVDALQKGSARATKSRVHSTSIAGDRKRRKLACGQCPHSGLRIGSYRGRIGPDSGCFRALPVMLLWLSIGFLSRLLLEPFPVACCEVVVAEDASFEPGDNGGPLAEFAGDRVDGQPEAFAFLA